ncbi:hypothetical protein V7S43_003142 [Phytophthora oleae]|uniref:RxLR effector protein n=1 Tax=Phytophthora oleae TaxID=2107226 RepID=A0ABD3FZU3_9STRA
MQITNVLLMAAVILFSCSDAATASSSELSTISSVDAVRPKTINQRFLRSDYDSEERTLPSLAKLDDLVVAKMSTKLFNTEKLQAALGKTKEASNARVILFKEVNAANPAVRKEFLAKLTKSDAYNWLLPYWVGFKLKNLAKFDTAELAAARRAGNAVN